MFCLLDVSGSMDEGRKNIAKRFFMLLYLFLTRNYERIEVVFIRHHTVAFEVDEDEFFTSRESGGTVVSSGAGTDAKIVIERYPSGDWNIYGAQASDGDNWDDDSPTAAQLLNSADPAADAVLRLHRNHRRPAAEPVARNTSSCRPAIRHFAMQRIASVTDIYPVFRELFKKQHEHETQPTAVSHSDLDKRAT